jgi:hypothetical protein
MYLYLQSLYTTWSYSRSPAECLDQQDRFIRMASSLLHYTEEEIRTALMAILK